MADLNSSTQLTEGKEDKKEQATEILDELNDNYPSESNASPLLLVLYAVITMGIIIWLLK